MEENSAQHKAFLVICREFTSSAQYRSFQIGPTGFTWITKEQMEHEQICLPKKLVMRASTPSTQWMSGYSDRLQPGPESSFLPAVRFHLLCSSRSSFGSIWSPGAESVCSENAPWCAGTVSGSTHTTRTRTLIWTHPQATKNNNDKMYCGQDCSFKQHKQELLKE